jgi:arginine N-succinyltransferase
MREGFETDHYIDIFDGGPTCIARTSGSARSPRGAGEIGEGQRRRQYLVANGQLQDYRAVLLELDRARQAGHPTWKPPKPWASAKGASVRLVAVERRRSLFEAQRACESAQAAELEEIA